MQRDELTNSLNCNLLRTYVRVVELGSITRAAESLFLAQSAVSSHVATLASFAGGSLFERREGRLVTTPLGAELYTGALEILGCVNDLDRRLQRIASQNSRVITVACTRTVCETAVAGVVASFQREFPEYRLSVVTATTKDAEGRLRSGEIDVALTEGANEIPGTRRYPFRKDRLMLAVPRNHDLAKRSSVTIAEASAYPFILRTRASGTRLLIEERLGRRFEELRVVLELEGNSEIVSCVEADIGISLLSQAALGRAHALGSVIVLAVEDVDLEREFYLALPEDREISEATSTFAKWLLESYSSAFQDMRAASSAISRLNLSGASKNGEWPTPV
jgi:DNA-binding transcriptional LysR family regulator